MRNSKKKTFLFFSRSNLSAAAAEFVPRAMPRNTSQWGYQNQPQPQQVIVFITLIKLYM